MPVDCVRCLHDEHAHSCVAFVSKKRKNETNFFRHPETFRTQAPMLQSCRRVLIEASKASNLSSIIACPRVQCFAKPRWQLPGAFSTARPYTDRCSCFCRIIFVQLFSAHACVCVCLLSYTFDRQAILKSFLTFCV